MEILLVKVKSKAKAKMLTALLKDMTFVAGVSLQSDESEAREEHEAMKRVVASRKNPAFAKYLE